MTDDETLTLWLGAFRYYLGRRTYAVESFCDMLRATLPNLPERAQLLIVDELDAAFKQDDAARANRSEFKPLGHDCDREQWERVRAMWINESTETKEPQ